jgi:predicted secreted protein
MNQHRGKKNTIAVLIFLFIIACFIASSSGTFRTIDDVSVKGDVNTPHLSNGPQEQWNMTYGGGNVDWGWSVQQTTDEGYIVTGETSSYGSGGFDAWLVKIDANGSEQWNRTFGGPAKDGGRSIRQTSDGGYFIGGYADSYGSPVHDAWFIKTDSTGNEEWNNTYGGQNSDGVTSVWQTNDSGYVGTGYSDSFGPGGHDVWLIKTDKYGDELWNRTFGTSAWDIGYSVKQVNDGGLVIIGTTNSYGAGGHDAWFIKTDSGGNEQWNRTYGGVANDWGSSVYQTNEGGYILTGDTRSYGNGGYDFWLIKTDKYGVEQWNKTYGESSSDDTAYCIQQTSDGGYIVTGTTTVLQSGLTDIWLMKTDSTGVMQWNKTIGGKYDDVSYSVEQITNGAYILTGYTTSYGSGDKDVWLIQVEGENQPPLSPSIEGPSYCVIGNKYEYSFSLSDPDNDLIYLKVNWGDGTITPWLGPYQTGHAITINYTWLVEGEYNLRAKARDTYGAESEWSDVVLVTVINDDAPTIPDIRGKTKGAPTIEYAYTFVSEDPNGDDIYYYIEWGDGDHSGWIGPYISGKRISINHTWSNKGDYTIKAKAKDVFDLESKWGTLKIEMPKNQQLINFFVLKFCTFISRFLWIVYV